LVAPARDPKNPVSEVTDRIWVATQRDSYRLERAWKDRKKDRTSVHVSDGITEWLPTYSGAFHSHPADPDTFPARNLLDPSWLAGYDWATPLPDIHNGRNVLVMHASLAAARAPDETDNRSAPTVLRQRPPAETDLVVDAEYGFLHRMTGLINSQPYVVEELLDVVLDPPLDESVFRIDPSKFQVIDPHDNPGDAVVHRAFTIASDQGRLRHPIHVLAALAEVDGPIGELLRAPDGGPLFPEAAAKPGKRGGGNGYVAAQVMSAASQLAEERGDPLGPAHLLIAVLDQGDAEVTATLASANIQAADARSLALHVLGGPADLPRLTMPRITPAGTWDRPPLAISELDQGAWASLSWRQDRLPLHRLRRKWEWSALSSLEQGAAWRVANRYHVDEDQRYSLLSHHHDKVEALAHRARPDLVETRQQMRERHQSGPYLRAVSRPRRIWERRVPGFMVGWPTWFSNRREGLRDKYFWLITLPDYRGQPGPTS
jgi:hypothetical protein